MQILRPVACRPCVCCCRCQRTGSALAGQQRSPPGLPPQSPRTGSGQPRLVARPVAPTQTCRLRSAGLPDPDRSLPAPLMLLEDGPGDVLISVDAVVDQLAPRVHAAGQDELVRV